MMHRSAVRRLLALAVLGIASVLAIGGARSGLPIPGRAAADTLSAAPGSRGTVVSADELPRDPSGGILVNDLDGVTPEQALQDDSAAQRGRLEAASDRVLWIVAPEDAPPDVIPPLPDDDTGPARMDSGDPDPDRLQLESVPVELRSGR